MILYKRIPYLWGYWLLGNGALLLVWVVCLSEGGLGEGSGRDLERVQEGMRGSGRGLGWGSRQYLPEMFQVQLLGEEIWGKICIFLDYIGVGYSKHLLQKSDPLLSWNVSNQTMWRGNMGKTAFFKDNIGCGYSKCSS